MDNATYKIDGMTCGGCVASVTNALARALPGLEVSVELEGGKLSIPGEHDPAAVAQAVEDAGYDFLGPI